MECVYLVEAEYKGDYKIFVRFNTGESGEADFQEIISRYKAAEPLQDKKNFSRFYLDSWPTLAWECGFDISPESLYLMVTGKSLIQKPVDKLAGLDISL